MSVEHSSKSTLIRSGLLVTMNAEFDIFIGDLRLRDGQIVEIAPRLEPLGDKRETVVDATGQFVIPGLIQAHTHLVQTLARGFADDLELMDWLKLRIWPYEAAHDDASIRAAAQVGLMEMQLLGTTSILDMGTVRLHEHIFSEAENSGMRYWGGNCLMDRKPHSGPLYRPTSDTLAYCEELISAWHKKTSRLQYAISPRFAVSCTDKMLRAAAALRDRHGLLLHTHASENRGEIQLVKKLTGRDNIHHLNHVNCLSARTVIAHGIHLRTSEVSAVIKTRTGVCHCPSSNLKLASGIAKIQSYRKNGMKVGLGADGAPCNNLMDPFMEMRLAALLQKPLFGPTALPARDAFELATRGGAEVLNASAEIGSLEVGKQADVVIVSRSHPSVALVEDPYSALVYSCTGRDVRDVWIHGREIVRNGEHKIYDQTRVLENASEQLARLKSRIKGFGLRGSTPGRRAHPR